MQYPGGKGKSYPQLINLLPPHRVYIETHLGGGAVLRNKAPAIRSIGIDRDASLIETWRARYPNLAEFVTGDAIDVLSNFPFVGDELIYCDPPYLPETRKRARVYRYDYTKDDHVRLLSLLRTLRCRVIVSGYPSDLYQALLPEWNTRTFLSKAHDGIRTECVWFNYEAPSRLHDARYLGASFREREAIRRRLGRIKERIHALSPQERHHLSDWLVANVQAGTAS